MPVSDEIVQQIKARWGINPSVSNEHDADAIQLVDIYEGVSALYRNADNEKAFIRVPQSKLNGRSVLDLMNSGEYEDALVFVNWFNGRN